MVREKNANVRSNTKKVPVSSRQFTTSALQWKLNETLGKSFKAEEKSDCFGQCKAMML